MLINHISVSRKKCYDLCPQQYKFRYHLKVPRPGEEPFYFVYGTIVHKIAEQYVVERGVRPIGEVADDILRGKIMLENNEPAPPIQEDYKKKFQKHLRAIQNLTDRVGSDGQTEYEFRYDLDPPNDKCVTGFIDRLIIRNDKAFIIDYKTTKKGTFRVNKETVKDDLQLRCYARVVQKEFGIKAENIKAALYYLEGEDLIAACYSEQSLLNVEKELLDAYNQIQESNPDKVWGRVGWHCKQCDYGSICPFFQSSSSNTNAAPFDGTMAGDAWA